MAINVADNFSYKGSKPLDARITYATVAAMAGAATADLYDGCFAYVTATQKYYSYDSSNTTDPTTGKWREYSSGGGGGQTIQVDTMPTASVEELGKIYQFVGTTGTYTNGYFYKCVSDGEEDPTYSWVQTDTQPEAELMPAADMSEVVTPLPGVMNRLPVYRNLLTSYDQELTTQKEIIGVTEDGYKVCRKIYAGQTRGSSGSFNTVVTGDTDLLSIASYFDVVSVHGVAYGVVGSNHQVMELSVPYIVLESGSLLMHQNYTSSTMTYNFRAEVVYVDRNL